MSKVLVVTTVFKTQYVIAMSITEVLIRLINFQGTWTTCSVLKITCKIEFVRLTSGYYQRSSFFLSSRSVVTLISERREVLLGFEWLSFKKLICVPFCLFQDAAPHFKLSKPTKWHRQVLVGHHQESLHFVDSLIVNCV